jgi:acyl-CoA reductase-like NAD-dependent aldehyde dehydrogenase
LAEQMAIEIGKPLTQALEEVRRAAASIRDVVRRAALQVAQRQAAAGVVRYLPIGVVAIITPWNNPLAIALGKIVPALVYGNTVVWKPAPAGTRIAQVVLRLLEEAGIPSRTVSLLTGDQTVARQLAAGAGVDAVTVTGSIQTGYVMQDICARRMVPLQAELSGNNAAVVWEDADLDHAVAQVAWGAFAFAGQRCTANRRVIVSARQFETILQGLEAAGNRLAWGNPCDEATVIGPVIHTAKRDEITALVDEVRTSGAAHRVVLLQGNQAGQPWVKAGAYARPAIVCCDQPDHPLVQEETMGPVLVVQRADDFEQAMELCNGVRHGLAAALFSTSPQRHSQFAELAQAGVLKFNTSTAGVDTTLPFGGWKASGLGPPEHGEGDPLFYTRVQAVYGNREV